MNKLLTTIALSFLPVTSFAKNLDYFGEFSRVSTDERYPCVYHLEVKIEGELPEATATFITQGVPQEGVDVNCDFANRTQVYSVESVKDHSAESYCIKYLDITGKKKDSVLDTYGPSTFTLKAVTSGSAPYCRGLSQNHLVTFSTTGIPTVYKEKKSRFPF